MKMSQASVCWGLWVGVLALASCASSAPEPQAPAAPTADPVESAAGEEKDPQAGHDLDVGMEFGQDQDEEEQEQEEQADERTPPPTRAYSPANRLTDEQQVEAEPAPGSE